MIFLHSQRRRTSFINDKLCFLKQIKGWRYHIYSNMLKSIVMMYEVVVTYLTTSMGQYKVTENLSTPVLVLSECTKEVINA